MSAWRRITPEEPEAWEEVRLWVPGFDGHRSNLAVTGFRLIDDQCNFALSQPFDAGTDTDIIVHPTHWQPLEEGPDEP